MEIQEKAHKSASKIRPPNIEAGAESILSNNHHESRRSESDLLRWLCVIVSSLFLRCSYARDIEWITGLDTALSLLFGIQVGPLMDRYGPKLLAPMAVGLTVTKFFLLGECKNYWQFLLCLGVLRGMACAIASTVAISSLGKLFIRRRGLAMGTAMACASARSIRILGLVALGFMVIGTVCLLPFPELILPETVPSKKKSAAINFVAFRSGPFLFITIGFFMFEFSITGIGVLLTTSAVEAGLTSRIEYTLVSVLNGCSCLGRTLPGFLSDYIGHFGAILLMTCLSLILTGVLFAPFGAQSLGILYAFAGLCGFCTGSFLSILPRTMSFVVSLRALIAIPAGGSLQEKAGSVGASGLYLATVPLGGSCFYFARSLLIGNFLIFRSNI
ncbi:mfs monocarboxylate [Colletotrichum incanum]|uniref:Mfs monocarboxylate n=1 Tax=Colletotrichum incanum TaxID=1573173 RepID=A0A166ZNK6_COLIC|nr:mfs monocarboxylate [Colletotrichum incanum]